MRLVHARMGARHLASNANTPGMCTGEHTTAKCTRLHISNIEHTLSHYMGNAGTAVPGGAKGGSSVYKCDQRAITRMLPSYYYMDGVRSRSPSWLKRSSRMDSSASPYRAAGSQNK